MRLNAKFKEEIAKCLGRSTGIEKFRQGAARTKKVLTVAESRVLALVVRANTNKEIAVELGISPATVKRHLENVLRKLGARNRVEAAISGLFLNGCSAEHSSSCPLQAWHEARETAGSIWAK